VGGVGALGALRRQECFGLSEARARKRLRFYGGTERKVRPVPTERERKKASLLFFTTGRRLTTVSQNTLPSVSGFAATANILKSRII
jgi:hypothetical protein